jgi:hypothetical protein
MTATPLTTEPTGGDLDSRRARAIVAALAVIQTVGYGTLSCPFASQAVLAQARAVLDLR